MTRDRSGFDVRRRELLVRGLGAAGAVWLGGCGSTPKRPRKGRGAVPTAHLVTDWRADRWARGAYSYLPVGATPADRRALGAPVDATLFFAGEATSTAHPATVHGALESGIRAAGEVLEIAERGETVLVVGAGAAGLAAAVTLKDAGVDVVVLEARDRVGGRAWTNDALGAAVDLGASWIHGPDGNPLTDLARDEGFDVVAASFDDVVLRDDRGRPVDADAVPDVAGLAISASDPSRASSISVADVLAARAAARPPRADERRLEAFAVAADITGEYGADPADLGVAALLEGDELEGEDTVLPRGMGTLITTAGRDFDVRTRSPVTAIDWSRGDVSATTDGGRRVHTDRAVITVPLGVLQAGDMGFSPALPATHRRAIGRLGMGVLDKTWLRFDDVFWPDAATFGFVPRRPGPWSAWLNLAPITGEPIVCAFNGGSYAASAAARGPDAAVRSATAALHAMFP